MKVEINSAGRLIYYFEKNDEDVLSIVNGSLYAVEDLDVEQYFEIENDHLLFVQSVFLALITDRTQADVDLVRSLAELGMPGMSAAQAEEWLSSLKGAYNYTDINRVGIAINALSAMLIAAGYSGVTPVKDDWTASDIFITAADLQPYLNALIVLRSALPVTLPPVPESYNALTYIKANNIEEILRVLYSTLKKIAASAVYSDMATSGMIWGEFA